ncbi:MAG: hypothetical protein ACI4A7_01475, partial [Prevotella sp.]
NIIMSGFIGMQVDPDELYNFRCQLSELSEKMMEQLRRTDAAMEAVAKEWQDVQFHKYHDEFTEDRDLIQPLSDQINQFQEGPLQQFENIAREYLEQ